MWGIFCCFSKFRSRCKEQPEYIVNFWFLSGVALMFIVDPNINRLNILMIPWIYYTAVGTAEFTGRFRRGLPIAALLFTAAFFTFVGFYFTHYAQKLKPYFFDGLGTAITQTAESDASRIYISSKVNMPYIFVLFYMQIDPFTYQEMDFLFFVQSAYLTGGLMMLFNPLIALLFGGEYCFPMTTVVIIVTEFYISRMRQTNLLFREVMGLFWNDRYKAVAESIINLVASIALVQRYGVAGIVGGTIISSLCTCVWVEPYIFLKYGVREDWQQKYRAYFAEYLKRLLLTAAVSAAAVLWVQRFPVSNFGIFILDGLLYTVVFAGVIVMVYHGSAEYAALKQRGLELLKRKKEYT